MRLKHLTFLIVFVILLISLSFLAAGQNRVRKSEGLTGANPSPTPPVFDSSTGGSRAEMESIIYSVLLTRIYYSSPNRELFTGLAGMNRLFFLKTAIDPPSRELVTNPAIPADVLEQFEHINSRSKKLDDGYDVKGSLTPIRKGRDVKKAFLEVKKAASTNKAVVAFSAIDFNHDYTRAVVYIEYYSEEKQLLKLYGIVPLVSASFRGQNIMEIDKNGIKFVPIETPLK